MALVGVVVSIKGIRKPRIKEEISLPCRDKFGKPREFKGKIVKIWEVEKDYLGIQVEFPDADTWRVEGEFVCSFQDKENNTLI